MITKKDIDKIMKESGMTRNPITVGDIKNVLLYNIIEDKSFITPNSEEYFASKPIKWLIKYVKEKLGDDESITFDENKKALIDLIEKTQKQAAAGEIEMKDALKIEADIRVKLNDKFKVQDDTKDKVVIVEKKYNHICRYGYECYLPTKEELMEQYNLVEKHQ